jgi:hypothetical protein
VWRAMGRLGGVEVLPRNGFRAGCIVVEAELS